MERTHHHIAICGSSPSHMADDVAFWESYTDSLVWRLREGKPFVMVDEDPLVLRAEGVQVRRWRGLIKTQALRREAETGVQE